MLAIMEGQRRRSPDSDGLQDIRILHDDAHLSVVGPGHKKQQWSGPSRLTKRQLEGRWKLVPMQRSFRAVKVSSYCENCHGSYLGLTKSDIKRKRQET